MTAHDHIRWSMVVRGKMPMEAEVVVEDDVVAIIKELGDAILTHAKV